MQIDSFCVDDEVIDIFSIGYVDTDQKNYTYEHSLREFYIKTNKATLKFKQFDLKNGTFVGISKCNQIFSESDSGEDENLCSSSIHSILLGTYSYEFSIKKIVPHGLFFEENKNFYCEGIELYLSNKFGIDRIVYFDPYDLDGLIIGCRHGNEAWQKP